MKYNVLKDAVFQSDCVRLLFRLWKNGTPSKRECYRKLLAQPALAVARRTTLRVEPWTYHVKEGARWGGGAATQAFEDVQRCLQLARFDLVGPLIHERNLLDFLFLRSTGLQHHRVTAAVLHRHLRGEEAAVLSASWVVWTNDTSAGQDLNMRRKKQKRLAKHVKSS